MAMTAGFIAELRRRNVIRMAGLYLVTAWLVVQVGATLLPVFDAPPWTMKALVIIRRTYRSGDCDAATRRHLRWTRIIVSCTRS